MNALADYIATPPLPPLPPTDPTHLRTALPAPKWLHCVHLPYSIITPGFREPNAWSLYHLPERLDGQRVLDIGAWEGQFSFEAERRGAAHVTAMDLWGNDPSKPDAEPGSMGAGWANFQFCHAALHSRVVSLNRNVYDLTPTQGPYDLVLFLEVLYHLQDPMRGLRNIASVLAPNGLLCLETWIDAEWIDAPAAIFYPGAELNGDPTNWWGPNIACVQSMAVAAGFKTCDIVYSRNDVHFGGRGKRVCFHARRA